MHISADGLTLEKITNDDIDANGQLKVAIPNSVTQIGGWAFNSCINLSSITIPNSVTLIGERAFDGCISLTSIIIPNLATHIGNDAFSGCTSLASITIPDSVNHIGNWVFNVCTNLTSITIPSSATQIGCGAFYGCTSLTSITIPNSVNLVGDRAFYGCTNLTNITIPNSETHICSDAFNGCISLTNVIIDSDDDKEVARITALLPDELQSKIVDKHLRKQAQNIQKASLNRIANEPKTTKASTIIWFGRLLPSLPLEMISEIGSHCDNKYVDEAKQEMQGLKIPTDNNWDEYTVKVNAIADKHITEAKTNYSKTVGFFCKGKNSADAEPEEEPAAQPAP